jgi:hypothetical protein
MPFERIALNHASTRPATNLLPSKNQGTGLLRGGLLGGLAENATATFA